MKIGFIGLGNMGRPIAQRIAAKGFDLTLYARRPASLEPFAGSGVTVAATPAELGAAVDAVGICVFDAAGVEEVLFGPDGLTETLRPGGIVLVHSTISPGQIRAIAERAAGSGVRVLDAPVSGGAPRAEAGELTIMVGGDADALAEVTQVLEASAAHVVHLGPVGAASCAKLINNTLFSAQIALADQALEAGRSLGVDPAGLAAVLSTGSSSCVASGLRLRFESLRDLTDSTAGSALTKDVTLMADLLGEAAGSELVRVARQFVAGLESGAAPGTRT
ncbi:MAG TPA: NAD(P)-dependent oxidoreductase [Amycolatopsis sp.]|nr:NAD(P)-dependent oxidoreductase [Amycolatopsis sp.]